MSGLVRGEEILDHLAVECPECEITWRLPDQLGELLPPGRETPTCPSCGAGCFIGRAEPAEQRAMAKRWTKRIAKYGFNATPALLGGNLQALGLSHFDYVLLEMLEQHRRGGADEEVWPSITELARLAGRAPSQLKARLAHLRDRGLIERRPRWNGRGRRSDCYTRHGLTEALDHIAANREAQRPDDAGIAELLDRLAREAKVRESGSPPAGNPALIKGRESGYRSRSSREAEAVEADSSSEASDSRRESTAPDQLPLRRPVELVPNDRDREIAAQVAARELTQAEIGRRHGISQGRVAQIAKVAGVGAGRGRRTDLAAGGAS